MKNTAGGIERKVSLIHLPWGEVKAKSPVTPMNGAFLARASFLDDAGRNIYDGWPPGGEIDIMEHKDRGNRIRDPSYDTYQLQAIRMICIKDPSTPHKNLQLSDRNIYKLEWSEHKLSSIIVRLSYLNLN